MEFEIIDGTKFINLSELALKAFPELVEISAIRKTSRHFRKICVKYNIDSEEYKPNKSRAYKIPLSEEKRWLLGVRHIEFSLGLELSREQTILLVEDVIEMKYDLEQSLMVNVSRNFKGLKNHDFHRIQSLYYNGGELSKEIAKYNFFRLEDQIQEDFEYILSSAKNKTVATHAETYIREVMEKVELVSKVTRQIIEDENKKKSE